MNNYMIPAALPAAYAQPMVDIRGELPEDGQKNAGEQGCQSLTDQEQLQIEGFYQHFLDKPELKEDQYVTFGIEEAVYTVSFDAKSLNTCTLKAIGG